MKNQKTRIGLILFPRLTQPDLTDPEEVFGRMPALANSASTQSPAALAIRPPCSAIKASMISRYDFSTRSVRTSSAPIRRVYPATSAA